MKLQFSRFLKNASSRIFLETRSGGVVKAIIPFPETPYTHDWVPGKNQRWSFPTSKGNADIL